jgi:HlyD family secretion protein
MGKIDTGKSLRRVILTGYVSIFAIGAIFVGWGMKSELNGAIIAPATIVAESFSKKVQHRDGGIVSRILVKDGDRVEGGQDLILLDTTDTKAELSVYEGMLDELLVKRARLEAQRDDKIELALPEEIAVKATQPNIASIISGQTKLLVSADDSNKGKRDQMLQQIAQLNDQIGGIEAQIVSQSSQMSLIEQELGSLKKLLEKGLVPQSRVLSMEREQARLQGVQAELTASKAGALSRIGEVKLRILQLDEDRRTEALTELRDTESRIAELTEKREASRAKLSRTSIKAPITGIVYQLAVHTEGGVIGSGEALMLILPEGDDLVLQAQVSPNDVDQITAGQAARVRFPGFNARVTPEVNAEVLQVAADTTRTDAQTPPFYAVRLIISADEIKRLGENKLKPGMMAEAFIQTEARSPLSYLIKPLLDQISHAMRET